VSALFSILVAIVAVTATCLLITLAVWMVFLVWSEITEEQAHRKRWRQ